jgi:CheY-like chemotaxis protein
MEKVMRILKRNILIVDDDQGVRDLLAAQLEERGYIVTIAEDGAIALSLLQQNHSFYHGLLTDFQMPRINGVELIRKSIESKVLPDRVIMISSLVNIHCDIQSMVKEFPEINLIEKPDIDFEFLDSLLKSE